MAARNIRHYASADSGKDRPTRRAGERNDRCPPISHHDCQFWRDGATIVRIVSVMFLYIAPRPTGNAGRRQYVKGGALIARNFTIVQAIRGLAAAWIVLFHASEGGHVPSLKAWLPDFISTAIFGTGHYGVPVFFALSGFVVAHSLTGIDITPNSYARFLLRRSIRLDPSYWVAIALGMAFAIAAAMVKHEPIPPYSQGQVLAHLIYAQRFLGYPAINGVFWTLAYEVQFYAFFAAAMIVPNRLTKAILCGAALCSAFGMFDGLVPGLFLNLWGCFFVGVIARWSADNRLWLPALLGLSVALVLHGLFNAVAAATALILYAAVDSGWAENGLSARPFQLLGTISYSLYLIHNPVTGAVGFVAHRIAGHGVLADLFALVAICAAVFGAAMLMWWTVERPSHQLSRRIKLVAPERGLVPARM
ncbi:acyltransferase [Sphingobium sp. H39-3-25]|uniref:acyltransferase family protein n=1 Tax=Sphingobium arseniciresistens TaxID=3030834 RepID=UPI0023B9EF27|nr:acyltransferase [Sphingobium arseniciresistens]